MGFEYDRIEWIYSGGGSEPEQYYTLWRRLHRHLDKHAVLQDSFRKFIEGEERARRRRELDRLFFFDCIACTDQSEQNQWLAKLDDSNWFFHIKETLTTACIIAQTIDREGRQSLSSFHRIIFLSFRRNIDSRSWK